MISNTRSGEGNLAPDAVGRSGQFTRPESPLRPFQLRVLLPPLVAGVERVAARPGAVTRTDCRARTPLPGITAERRVAPHPQRAAHHFAPVLYQTRHSPAGPKHQHRQEQAVAGSERIHGPRMLMNGETYSADLDERRAQIVGHS